MTTSSGTPVFGTELSSSTLTALFDNRADADAAVEELKTAGIADGSIRLVPGYESDSPAVEPGFWEQLKDFFLPDDDRATYSEGLRRGGFMVSVSGLSEAQYATAHDILDDVGSIDLDERADQWRNDGWQQSASSQQYTPGQATPADKPAPDLSSTSGPSETIPVVEENLRVGKRDVNRGSLKVRAYTVERPVSENVSLTDQTVSVNRRPVDRPLSDADRAFEDRTISAEEHHQEAVVSKEARVVEEIDISRDEAERTQKVEDTVRKTKIELDDQRDRPIRRR